MEHMDFDEFNDFVFSRLHKNTHMVIIESYGMGLVADLYSYLSHNEKTKDLLTDDNFKSFPSQHPSPSLTVINKEFFSRDLFAHFVESGGQKEAAHIIRTASTERDIIVLALPGDQVIQVTCMGMDLHYKRWQKMKNI